MKNYFSSIKNKRASRLILAGVITLAVLIGFAIYTIITASHSPKTIWLPKESNDTISNEEAPYRTITTQGNTITRFGRAVTYSSDKKWQQIYELRSTPALIANTCPNISGAESLMPSSCKKIGTFQNSSVYAINRSLPSGSTEYFVKINDTFILIKSSGDGGQSMDYLNTFVRIPRQDISAYLTKNKVHLRTVYAKQRAIQGGIDAKNATAISRLDFTPALPKTIPSGWHLTDREYRYELDGPDADHPSMISFVYADKADKHFINMHVGRLSDYTLASQCGPSPGYSMGYFACHKVDGTDYFEAVSYDSSNDYVRYLYRPVGDSIVISSIYEYSPGNGKRAHIPTDQLTVQDTLTTSAEPVAKDTIIDSAYNKIYF